MTPATAQAIEQWLFEQGGWVSREHICNRWDVYDRELRPKGNKAGLLDGFAISRSAGGYIHLDHATDAEFGAYFNRKREHGQAEIDSANALLKRRLAGPRHRAPLVQQGLAL